MIKNKVNNKYRQQGLGTGSILFVIFVTVGLAGAFYWLVLRPSEMRPTYVSPASQATVETEAGIPRYEASINFPESMVGLAWNGEGFVAANVNSPFGFVRVFRDSDNATKTEDIAVVETGTNVKLGFPGIGWNGTNYISMLTRRSPLTGRHDYFTVHDPVNFSILKLADAPPDIGCIAWDGKQYWAGTRIGVDSKGTTGFLYSLDKDFKVLSETEVPMRSCRGLAWDGYRILWADELGNSLHLVDVSAGKPRVVLVYKTSTSVLSGVAYDSENLWIADLGRKVISRLDPRLQQQWLIGDYSVKSASDLARLNAPASGASGEPEEMTIIAPLIRGPMSKEQVDEFVASTKTQYGYLRTKELLNYAIPRIFDQNVKRMVRSYYDDMEKYGGFSYVDDRVLAPEAIQFSYLKVYVENNTMYGSWKVVVGKSIVEALDEPVPDNASNPLNPSIRYTIFVETSNSNEPYKREFEISENTDTQDNYVLLSELEGGQYIVRATMNAEYYINGKGRTYSSSVDPHLIRLER